MNYNKSILFILPVSSQPRFAKRIRTYLNEGYNIQIASYERDYFEKNSLPSELKYISLGKIEASNYLKRLPILLWSLFPLLKLIKKYELIYIFSPDVLILIFPFIRKKRLQFEIGDIRSVDNAGIISNFFHFLFRIALNKCDHIIVTSKGFKNYLLTKYKLKSQMITVVENKLSENDFPSHKRLSFKSIKKESFTIGIIGLLRYNNILSFLKVYSQKKRNYDVKIFGDGPLRDEILYYVNGESIQYFGQFKYPDDISDLYNQIDLSFTMYDSNNLNVRLALPNKLYESIYFRRPILVSKGTYLEKMVEKFDIGFSWPQDEMSSLVEYLDSIEFRLTYNKMKSNFENIPEDNYILKNSIIRS